MQKTIAATAISLVHLAVECEDRVEGLNSRSSVEAVSGRYRAWGSLEYEIRFPGATDKPSTESVDSLNIQ